MAKQRISYHDEEETVLQSKVQESKGRREDGEAKRNTGVEPSVDRAAGLGSNYIMDAGRHLDNRQVRA